MFQNSKYSRFFIFLVISFLIIFIFSSVGVEIIMARPGGGNSYSGGSSSGGGGGDGIAMLIYFILTELPPQISIPLVIGIIIIRFIIVRKRKKEAQTVSSAPDMQARANRQNTVDSMVDQFKIQDPNFSKVLFLDFASSIFNKYYTNFGKNDFKNLAPFVQKFELEESKKTNSGQEINEIVIGNINISDIQMYNDVVGIAVDIDANFTVKIGTKKTRYHVVERWYYNRKAGILSLEPDKLRKLSCPNCGGTSDFTDAGVCNHCNTFITNGEMQWFVKTHKVISQEVFRTKGLAHYEVERGTNDLTIYQTTLNQNVALFSQMHNIDYTVWEKKFVNEVVFQYFTKIYKAWSNNKLDTVRNLLTDRLYESFMFWIDNYKKEGLTNRLDDVEVDDIELVSIEIDKFYESITLRIFARAKDYVADSSGNVVGGSEKKPREFSEYWTFIRRSGVETDSYDYSTCPSCGASADKMGSAGVCEYCGTKISNGDFSWVLALITQDEVYDG